MKNIICNNPACENSKDGICKYINVRFKSVLGCAPSKLIEDGNEVEWSDLHCNKFKMKDCYISK